MPRMTRTPPALWLCLGLALLGAFVPTLVLTGGVAPVVVAAALALAVAWWVPSGVPLPPEAVQTGLPVFAGSALALATQDLAPSAVVVSLALGLPALLLGTAVLVPVGGTALLAALGCTALAGIAIGVAGVAPWTALVPAWPAAEGWLPEALVLGVLLGLAAAQPDQPERSARRPVLRAAALSGCTVGVAIVVAAAWEASPLPGTTAGLSLPAVIGALRVLLVLPLIAVLPGARRDRPVLVEAAAWLGWFALAGTGAALWTLTLLAPVGMAMRLAREPRTLAGLGMATLLLVGAVLSFPGIPASTSAAVGAAATIVVLVWRLGWPRTKDVAT